MAKTTSKKKGTTKKKTTTKSTTKKQTTTAKPKSTQAKSTAAKKKPAARKKPTIKELLAKKFDTWQPETLYTPPAADHAQKDVTAPPFVPEEMAEDVRPLLFKKFDLSEAAPASQKREASAREKEEEKAPAPRKKEPVSEPVSEQVPEQALEKDQGKDQEEKQEKAPKIVSQRELLQKKFDAWKPSSPFKPTRPAERDFTAPPFAAGEDGQRISSLLMKKFDLSDVEPVQPTPPPKAEALPPEEKAPEEKAPEPEAEAPPPEEKAPEPEAEAPPPEEKAPEPESKAPEPEAEPPKAVSQRELLRKRFDAWKPSSPFKPTRPAERDFTAPPIASGSDAERIRSLLLQKIDLSDIPPRPQAAEVPEAEVVDQKTEVPEEVKTSPGEPAVEEAVEEKKAEEAAAEEDVETREAVHPPTVKKGSDPMETTMKFFAASLAVIFALILWASFSNASKYYLAPTDQGLEIWKGNFAPLGKERVVRLPDVSAPATLQPVYSREEVYPLAFDYYINKADAILVAPGTPNYDAVEKNLNRAVEYSTKANAKLAFSKMKDLRLIILMNKADIAATLGTEAGLKEALAYLEQAAAFDSNDLLDLKRTSKAELIERKIEGIRSMLENVRQPPAIVPEPTPAS